MTYWWLKYPFTYPRTVRKETQLRHIAKRLRTASELLQTQGFKVIRSGTTNSDPMAAWFVVHDRCPDSVSVRRKLGPLDRHIERVDEIKHPDEGVALGRQLELFPGSNPAYPTGDVEDRP